MSSTNEAKRAAGFEAAKRVEPGMIVGLGTGTTAAYFIQALIERQLRITAVATSNASAELASKGGIEIRDINELTAIDLTVDGADEIDHKKQMIKGGGGAHLKEKIVAAMSDRYIIIIDSSKEVRQLGKHPLPVEISSFAFRATIRHLEKAGFSGKLRPNYTTDSGNYIFDIQLEKPLTDPEGVNRSLELIPGVLETGLFLGFSPEVIVGFEDGHTEIRA